jgi:hypothetical protein
MSALPTIVKKEVAILNRLFRRGAKGISPEAAYALLDIRFDQIDIDRMHELSLKAQKGLLSPAEDKEMNFYSTWGNIVGILHSKARLALKQRGLPVPEKPPPVPTEYKAESRQPRRRTR